MGRWTQDRDIPKLRYQPALDPKGRGWHYLWEGGGFGMQVYLKGRRKYIQCGSRKNARTNRWSSYFRSLGNVDRVKLAEARAIGERIRVELREARDEEALAAAEAARAEITALANTPLRDAMAYYVTNRNCAPVSKSLLQQILNTHLGDWMKLPLLSIDAPMLQERYHRVLAAFKKRGEAYAARTRKYSPEKRLLLAPDGYFNGIKTAHDTVEGFGRVYRYWVVKHMARLQRGGVLVPACPTPALMDDLIPAPQRVKGLPPSDLSQLFGSFRTYPDNELHPLLLRFLLATGIRVGIAMYCKMEFIRRDRIVIPASTERSKVRWRKRHLDHMAFVIPLTPEIEGILEEIAAVAPHYGDAETWLFPSMTAKSGHMEEERAATLRLRRHSGVRFNLHQLRHNVASAAEELGFPKSDISELLGHTQSSVTDRYIDERVKRHRRLLTAVNEHLSRVIEERPGGADATGETDPGMPAQVAA